MISFIYNNVYQKKNRRITHRFDSDLIYFDKNEITNIIKDFNNNNGNMVIDEQIANEIYAVTGG